jgi:hypothetical protein
MRKKSLLVVAVCFFVAGGVFAQVSNGSPFPVFSLKTGGGKILHSADLAGKYVVMFYETKEKKDLNREIKNRLNRLYDGLGPAQRDQVVRLPVIDCTWAFWPFTAIWESEMEKNAKIEKMDIWGDWNGSLRKEFGFLENEIYTLIIDDGGTVRFLEKGVLTQGQMIQAEALITEFMEKEPIQ